MFKKLKLFSSWRKTINSSRSELQQRFNLRIDKAMRLYTVINIPEELIGEAYSLKKSDIDRISETYLREFSFELSKFLNGKNLQELYEVYEIKKVDKYSYLIVFGFSQFKTNKFYNWIYFGVIPTGIILTLITLLILLL